MIIDVDFLDEGHNPSSRPVAYLNSARLERNLES